MNNPHRMPSFLRTNVSQVAIIVRCLEETVEHYWKDLGIGPWHFYTYKKPYIKKMTYRGKLSEYKMRVALANLGQVQLELIEVMEGDTIYADFVKEHGYGLHHIQFLIDDVQTALAEVEELGLEVIQDGSGFGLDGDGYYGYLNTEEKFGFTIELVSRPQKRAAPEKTFPIEL